MRSPASSSPVACEAIVLTMVRALSVRVSTSSPSGCGYVRATIPQGAVQFKPGSAIVRPFTFSAGWRAPIVPHRERASHARRAEGLRRRGDESRVVREDHGMYPVAQLQLL